MTAFTHFRWRGTLYAGAMPGWPHDGVLEMELSNIARHGIAYLLCMVPADELAEIFHRSDYAEKLGTKLGPGHGFLGVPDFSTPPDRVAFRGEVERVERRLARGESVLVHCAAGCGRTGMFVAALLCSAGMSPRKAIALFHARRGCGPETREQVDFVNWFASRRGRLSGSSCSC